jgi:hypothetical protein
MSRQSSLSVPGWPSASVLSFFRSSALQAGLAQTGCLVVTLCSLFVHYLVRGFVGLIVALEPARRSSPQRHRDVHANVALLDVLTAFPIEPGELMTVPRRGSGKSFSVLQKFTKQDATTGIYRIP